ncbi:MAG: 50S ribosomal protein L11 methyltransferase [Pseudothermotoga sp.]
MKNMTFTGTTEWHLLTDCIEVLEEELISRDFFNYAVEYMANGTRVILYTEDEDFVKNIIEFTNSKLLEKKISCADNWFKYMKLEPFQITEKIWIDPKGSLDDKDVIVVKMRPSAAFGTGDHPTTILAAKFLAQYLMSNHSVLDIGCGTAILAIIAAKLGAEKVTAVDNDPVAVEVAKEFVKENQVEVDVILSDLTNNVEGKYDLVVANILTPVIMQLMRQIHKVTHTGSLLIVSGIPTKDELVIRKCFESKSFEILSEGEMQNWRAFAVKIC